MNIYGFFEKYNPLKKIILFAPENWAIVFKRQMALYFQDKDMPLKNC